MKNHNDTICNGCNNGRLCANNIPIFSILKDEELHQICKKVIVLNYKKGDILFREGEISNRLFIIISGKVKLYKYTKEGKEQILFIKTDGDFVGLLDILKTGKYEFNAQSLEDLQICTLLKTDFDNILLTHPKMCLKIIEKLHDKLVSLENLVQTLSTKDIEARIAGLLISFSKDFGKETKNGVEIDLPLSREDMGNFIGITRETVSRKLASLQDDNIIELINNKKILIKDIDALKKIQ